jgi:hypothetical protein
MKPPEQQDWDEKPVSRQGGYTKKVDVAKGLVVEP